MHSNSEIEMDRRFFGYGNWTAPYWFIGPEQGRGPGESEGHEQRVEAWIASGRPELCDCRDYHEKILAPQWHRQDARLQPTWKSLILCLLTVMNHQADNVHLRNYQRSRWGMSDRPETCVIDLSGLASRSLSGLLNNRAFIEGRVEVIRQRIQEHDPKLILMYGLTCRKHWSEIARLELEVDEPVKREGHVYAVAPHPVSFGRKRSDWVELGQRCRELLI